MKSYLFILSSILLVGCAYGSVDTLDDDNVNDTNVLLPPRSEQTDLSDDRTEYHFARSLRTPCNPDKFLADSIPAGYKIDPNCPPVIIWPPKIILKGDPGPVIRHDGV
jgi:hypothetical protein